MSEKILVINPPSGMFPLGMAYVLASLEKHGIEFDFYDAQFGDGYKKLIRKNRYSAVATGGLIFRLKFFLEVSRFLRENRPEVPFILGGAITKDIPAVFLFDKLNAAYGIIGEAETSFPFLIKSLLDGRNDFGAVPGIIYKDNKTGEIRRNPAKRFDLSENDILPAWRFFDVDYYINNWEHGVFGRRRYMPVISGRGCMGTCSFCSNVMGAFQKRLLKNVISEIEILNERYSFDWFGFYNEMFYSKKEDIIEFCEAYRSMKPVKKWTCDLRVDADIDIDTFRLMKDSGCVTVFGGLESGSDKILSLMQKRTTKEMIIRFYRLAEEAGLPCIGGFLVGNEGETEAEIRETVDMVCSERMRALDAVVCTYPGTKIYKNAKKKGLITDEWGYLQLLDFFPEIWDCSWPKKEYLNISDIPNDRFCKTVVSELRRFHTFNLKNYVPGKITYSFRFGLMMKVAGECSGCGGLVSFTTRRRMLGLETFCGNCFRRVIFNLYELPEFAGHFGRLYSELKSIKRLAVAGTGIEALNLIKYDYFGLDYDSIAAFVEIDSERSGRKEFYCYPRAAVESLPEINPDAVLIADDLFGVVELKIRRTYLKANLIPPKILHLFPDEMRPYKEIIRFLRKHNFSKRWNYGPIRAAIGIPILVAEQIERLVTMIKSRSNVITHILLNRIKKL